MQMGNKIESKCQCCAKLEGKRKFAWRSYFNCVDAFQEIIKDLCVSGLLNDNQKRIIKNMWFNQEPEYRKCVVCIEILDNTNHIVLNKCGHIHHKDCIEQCSRCPLCRDDLILMDL
jgi:hypothetical protein